MAAHLAPCDINAGSGAALSCDSAGTGEVTRPEGSDTELRPGAVVGEYQITHLLGEGGMGVVYGGTHPEIGKRVAIKVLAPHAAQHPDLIRRFKEEARAVNKIRHPNIIDIFAFNQLPDGRHYFVMEYLEGESLTARLERGSMEFVEMRRLLAQICSALEAAHEAGIVHRDLKPDNIWVATQHRSESRIKLLDFGIAKLNDLTNVNATQSGVSMGTPHYMPPEQAMGRPVDHRADIYALGVVLYQIFAGTLPFNGATAHEIVLKHVTEPPRSPSIHRPIVPAAMERIILDCLEKAPEQRPQSIGELSRRIEAAFAGEGDLPTGRRRGAAIPRLPAAAASPPSFDQPVPGRTVALGDPDAGSGIAAPQPMPATTLRGATGEHAVSGGDDLSIAVAAGRGWRLPAVGIALAALVAMAVGLGVRGRFTSEASGPTAAPARAETAAAAAAPPAPVPSPRPAEKPAPALAPAEVPAPPKGAPRVPTAAETSPPAHSRKHEHRRPIASAGAPPPPEPATVPKPVAALKPAAAKPNCTPNFYFDAQGDKHFKPECF
jgi:eukaryotic-like serine/threonine-protein kinase